MRTEQSHSGQTFIYAGSRTLERLSYYGMRSILVLYMIKQLGMEQANVITIYSVFTGIYLLSGLVGGLLGDLLLGNKNAMLIGGLIQAVGCFAIAVPVQLCLFIGMGLVILGGGLYNANILAQFGKLYLHKPRLLDAAFMILYVGVNVGAMLGGLFIGQIGEVNFEIGFVASGVIMLLAIALPFFMKEKQTEAPTVLNQAPLSDRIVIIVIGFILIGIFWSVYELSGNGMYLIQSKIENLFSGTFPSAVWQIFNPAFTILLGIILSIIWTFYHQNQLLKVMLAFLCAAIGYGVLLLIPEDVNTFSAVLLLLAILILAVSELFIAPVILSAVTQYSNPKYLAIMMSLGLLPSRLFSYCLMMLGSYLPDDGSLTLKVSAVIVGFFGLLLMILFIVFRRARIFS